ELPNDGISDPVKRGKELRLAICPDPEKVGAIDAVLLDRIEEVVCRVISHRIVVEAKHSGPYGNEQDRIAAQVEGYKVSLYRIPVWTRQKDAFITDGERLIIVARQRQLRISVGGMSGRNEPC